MTLLEKAAKIAWGDDYSAVRKRAFEASINPFDPVSRMDGRWIKHQQYWRDRVLVEYRKLASSASEASL